MSEPIKLPPDLLAVTLVREGVNKHRARDIECWMNEKMALAVEQNTAALRAERDKLRDFALYYARCPCCQQEANCVADCTFSSDDPNAAAAMDTARAALKEVK